jgi:predicted RNA-binding Zn ribbon-like protein
MVIKKKRVVSSSVLMAGRRKKLHPTIVGRRPPLFELTAGVLCLDFVNTLDNRPSGEPKELLARYGDLVRFAEDTGILTPEQADRLFAWSEADPDEAQRVLHAAVELREAMYAVFSAVIAKRAVPASPLAMLNSSIQLAAQHVCLTPANGGFAWWYDRDGDSPGGVETMLWPIVRSAAELLASDNLPFVRACSARTCQWFFLDTSKNHRRRWCSMKLCGNRAKVQKFYARQREG